MPEAVIVVAARRPIGAGEGSLESIRHDDLATQIVSALLGEGARAATRQPAGEAGVNPGRVVAVLSGLDDVPGVTVNRYCSSRPSSASAERSGSPQRTVRGSG